MKAVLVFLLIALNGCMSQTKYPLAKDIIGLYRFTDGQVEERIEMKGDSTFAYSASLPEPLTFEGRWEWRRPPGEDADHTWGPGISGIDFTGWRHRDNNILSDPAYQLGLAGFDVSGTLFIHIRDKRFNVSILGIGPGLFR